METICFFHLRKLLSDDYPRNQDSFIFEILRKLKLWRTLFNSGIVHDTGTITFKIFVHIYLLDERKFNILKNFPLSRKPKILFNVQKISIERIFETIIFLSIKNLLFIKKQVLKNKPWDTIFYKQTPNKSGAIFTRN